MATPSSPGLLDALVMSAIREFCARQYKASGAKQYGINEARLVEILAEVVSERDHATPEAEIHGFLTSLRLEELVLVRACMSGNESAWDIFLFRFRPTLYDAAYKIAKEDRAARELADSLYAELFGVDAKGHERTSKLAYYQGRGSLQGWLRAVVAQEYINLYRRAKRETSLDQALDDGKQFEAKEEEVSVADPRAEAAATAELATLEAEERFLLVAYYLDRRTLADIAKLMRVHESTISRRLERVVSGLRKRIHKRMMDSGMSQRQADEAMQDVDVRDLRVKVDETLRQGTPSGAFYKQKSEPR
jgi:RNA polymerase sigma-70 factor (ECF subfamily)